MTVKDIYEIILKATASLSNRFGNRALNATFFMALSMLLLTSMLGYNHYAGNQVYAVYIEGVELGVVKDAKDIELFY